MPKVWIVSNLLGLVCAAVTVAFAALSLWLVIDGRVHWMAAPISLAMLVTAYRGARPTPLGEI